MKRQIFLSLLLFLGSCSNAKREVTVDQTFDAQMAAQSLSAAIPDTSRLKVHAICGPSAGKGLFEDDRFSEFQADGISNGRLIFYSAADDSGANLAFKDAGQKYISAAQDGALVQILGPEAKTWVVTYPKTGVVEVHSFVMRGSQLIDLWTVNKPSLNVWSPSAKVFTSNCFRP